MTLGEPARTLSVQLAIPVQSGSEREDLPPSPGQFLSATAFYGDGRLNRKAALTGSPSVMIAGNSYGNENRNLGADNRRWIHLVQRASPPGR